MSIGGPTCQVTTVQPPAGSVGLLRTWISHRSRFSPLESLLILLIQ